MSQTIGTGRQKNNIPIIDYIFLLIFVFLFMIILIDHYILRMKLLFEQTATGTSIFGLISFYLIFFYFVLWGCLKTKVFSKTKLERRIIVFEAFGFVGFRKLSLPDILYSEFSVFIGVAFNFLTLFLASYFFKGNLRLLWPIDPLIILNNLVIAPVFEELIYRDIYLSVFINILGRSYYKAIMAITLSSFTFGWIHPILPMLKAFGGFLLGSIYLLKWKKNILESIFAHFGVNIIGTFIEVIIQ
jgi:membrane protease YdiL (CAAX protease family)